MAVEQQQARWQTSTWHRQITAGLQEINEGQPLAPPLPPLVVDDAPTGRPVAPRPRQQPAIPQQPQPTRRERTDSQPTVSYEFETEAVVQGRTRSTFDRLGLAMSVVFGSLVGVALVWGIVTALNFGGYVLDVASCQAQPLCQARFYFGGPGEQVTKRPSKLLAENTGMRFSIVYKPGDEWVIGGQPVSKLVWAVDVPPGQDKVRPRMRGCSLRGGPQTDAVVVVFGSIEIGMLYDQVADTLRNLTAEEQLKYYDKLKECQP